MCVKIKMKERKKWMFSRWVLLPLKVKRKSERRLHAAHGRACWAWARTWAQFPAPQKESEARPLSWAPWRLMATLRSIRGRYYKWAIKQARREWERSGQKENRELSKGLALKGSREMSAVPKENRRRHQIPPKLELQVVLRKPPSSFLIGLRASKSCQTWGPEFCL